MNNCTYSGITFKKALALILIPAYVYYSVEFVAKFYGQGGTFFMHSLGCAFFNFGGSI